MLKVNEEVQEEALSEDVAHIAQVLADSLPSLQFKQASSNSFTSSTFDPILINYNTLMDLCHAHQTKQGETGTHQFMQQGKLDAPSETLPILEPA